MDSLTAAVAGVGADPDDGEDVRQKKALLTTVTVIILPISLAWGFLYLGFGSPGGLLAFLYFGISLGSLVAFARTRRFEPFLLTQIVDILVMPTAGQTATGGFLASGGVGM